jgi:hypothetical protein
MALTIKYTQDFGNGIILDTEEAYLKINRISGNSNYIAIDASIFKDKDARDAEVNFISQNLYSFTPDLKSADNFIKQAYYFLKTLNEFKDAGDC